MFWPFSDEFSLLCRYVFELISMQSVLLILYVMKQYYISPSNSTLFLHSQIELTILKIKRFFQLVSKICFYVFLDRFAFLDWDRVSLRSKYLVIAVVYCAAHDYVAYFIKGAVSHITLQIKILNMRNAHTRHNDNARIIIIYQL